MHPSEQAQPEGGARAVFAALAATDSDEAALARLAALITGPGDPAIERIKQLMQPASPTPDSPSVPAPSPWKSPQERVLAAAACVGRLESVDHDYVEVVGTAWLVRPDVAVTRRRPVATALNQLDRGERTLQIALGDDTSIVKVLEVLYLSPDCDLAFLRVAPQPSHIELATELDHHHDLAVLGPAGDPAEAPAGSTAVAAGNWLVPGRLVEIAAQRLRHDCPGWPRGVGSPLIDLARGQAIGLALDGGTALPAWLLRDRLDRLLR
ncbi:serine protease [Nannocystis pusilla]|uniref:Serine protease n=1 Tax=Nannocystis pusilla TaxID=889268 RepID=A0ABS7TRB0_9BACT|nr:serine protease [Nannocystis pusilla]MBZ5710769.1 serine protease [Nannocystis pusilla]